MAHACGVSVEGELGCLGSLETGMMGEEDGHGAEGKLDHSQLLTDPDEAVEFVRQTQVDALAVAIGTSHGAYKFTQPPTGEVLAISHLKTLQQRLPNTHLLCMAPVLFRRIGWKLLIPMVEISARPMVFPWKKLLKV